MTVLQQRLLVDAQVTGDIPSARRGHALTSAPNGKVYMFAGYTSTLEWTQIQTLDMLIILKCNFLPHEINHESTNPKPEVDSVSLDFAFQITHPEICFSSHQQQMHGRASQPQGPCHLRAGMLVSARAPMDSCIRSEAAFHMAQVRLSIQPVTQHVLKSTHKLHTLLSCPS